MSLRFGWTVSIVGLVALLAGAGGLWIGLDDRRQADRATADALAVQVAALVAAARSPAGPVASLERTAAHLGIEVEVREQLVRPDAAPLSPGWVEALELGLQHHLRDVVVYVQPQDPSDAEWAVVDVQSTLDDDRWWSARLRTPIETHGSRGLLTILALVAVAATAATVVVRRSLDPLDRLVSAAEALGVDLHAVPIDEVGARELRRLAIALNRMQFRLQLLLEDRQQMLASISHDLKTPITRLRLRASRIEDEILRETIDDELARLSDQVGSILDLLRGLDVNESSHPVDLGALVESVVDDVALENVRCEIDCDITARCRPNATRRIVTNLVENAGRYGAPPIVVTVSTAAGSIEIRVDDAGPGFSPEDLVRVFLPYARGSASEGSSGSGLGLAIARRLARDQGGDVRVENRPAGGGSAILRLPIPSDGAAKRAESP